MYLFIRGINVCALLSVGWSSVSNNGTTNNLFDTRSVPPKSHTCFNSLTLLYFRRTNKVSSISTTTPSPPIGCWLSNQCYVTSEQKLLQSTDVLWVIFRQLTTVSWSQCFDSQWFTNNNNFHGGRWARSKNVPLESLTENGHFLRRFVLETFIHWLQNHFFFISTICTQGPTMWTFHWYRKHPMNSQIVYSFIIVLIKIANKFEIIGITRYAELCHYQSIRRN